MISRPPDASSSWEVSESALTALMSTNGIDSASRTTARTPGAAPTDRIVLAALSALAKNRPPSTLTMTTSGEVVFSGCRATSLYCSEPGSCMAGTVGSRPRHHLNSG
jgi:hypothetical protein